MTSTFDLDSWDIVRSVTPTASVSHFTSLRYHRGKSEERKLLAWRTESNLIFHRPSGSNYITRLNRRGSKFRFKAIADTIFVLMRGVVTEVRINDGTHRPVAARPPAGSTLMTVHDQQ